ncbi:unnamed protein product [Linum tenue]|uniref:DOG1 domain-containing protein n=1 Tax=Linum tenue TaxID=586396 RepID=A0AAV0KJN8_9ROSI|nr:unnamed protein product [Linum tenue]
MKKTVPQFLWNSYEATDREIRQEGEGMSREEGSKGDDVDESDGTQVIQCMITFRKQDITHQKEGYWGKYGLWRQEQKTRAARLQKQLKARWESEESIHDQLNRFHAHYHRFIIPTKLNDVSQLLMPSSAPPHELATLAWLGDWRPSSILELLCGLAHCSSSSSSDESNMSQLMHEIRIEEAVIDEEMAEIQATCVLHLPFVNSPQQSGYGDEMGCIETEFRKIQSAIAKAQQLRFKTLELLVKKVLGQTKAAEFFVAFVKVQEVIHNHAAKLKLPKGPLTIPVKHLVIKGSF